MSDDRDIEEVLAEIAKEVPLDAWPQKQVTLNENDVRKVCEGVLENTYYEEPKGFYGTVSVCQFCDNEKDAPHGHSNDCITKTALHLLTEIERNSDEQGNG